MGPKNIKIKKSRGRPKNENIPDIPPATFFEDLISSSNIPLLSEKDDDKIRQPDKVINECLLLPDEEYDNILNQLRNSVDEPSIYPPEFLGGKDKELQLALEMSMKENPNYNDNQEEIDKILIFSKQEFEENLKNKKKKRKNELSNFLKKLQFLNFPYIMEQLNEYFECNIDEIYLEKKLHNEIFEIINSYYKIPNEKGRRCAIFEEEDNILRNLFLEKK